ncbi:putative reverse transcriptase zinc-binding domain-containing protein [Helianthus annuus]|nr:putative reverse transcriptase zinc-binding domain-containing protein [Helianthus annuus]
MNCGLLSKWAWRYKTEPNRLWRVIVKSIHFNPKLGNFLPSKKGLTGVWNNIIKKEASLRETDIHLNKLFKCKVGSGSEVQFWTDVWASDIPFKMIFPSLYMLEKFKGCSVRERLLDMDTNNGYGVNWCWLRNPFSSQECTELSELSNILSQVSLSSSRDTWSWMSDPTGNFSVKSVKKLLSRCDQQTANSSFVWNNWVPRKVNIFGWRLGLDRLPTRMALAHRNINMVSVCCPLCRDKDESSFHLFAECYVSSVVWEMISSWLNIPPIYAFTIEDLLQVHQNISGPTALKKMVQAIVLTACWSIWKQRNETIFSSSRVDIPKILAEIKSASFLWIKNRAKMYSLDFSDWCSFNVW